MRTSLVVALLCLSACAGVQLPKEKLTDAPGGLLFNGYTNANVECYRCHNGDGMGSGRGPALGDHVRADKDEDLTQTILEGDGWMPAHKDKLSKEEIGQILAWLHTAFP